MKFFKVIASFKVANQEKKPNLEHFLKLPKTAIIESSHQKKKLGFLYTLLKSPIHSECTNMNQKLEIIVQITHKNSTNIEIQAEFNLKNSNRNVEIIHYETISFHG